MPCEGQRGMLRSVAVAELQNRDEINRHLEAQTEEDDRQQAEQMHPMLHVGQAETARLRSQLVHEGGQSRAIVEPTRAQANI